MENTKLTKVQYSVEARGSGAEKVHKIVTHQIFGDDTERILKSKGFKTEAEAQSQLEDTLIKLTDSKKNLQEQLEHYDMLIAGLKEYLS